MGWASTCALPLLAAGITAGLLSGWSTAAGAVDEDEFPSATGETVIITLLTGDHVTLRGLGERAQLDIVPAKGRDVTFQVTRIGDATTVIPSDALDLVATGRLDRGLFDVTMLVEAGYDDAGGQTMSVIATYGNGAQGRASLTAAGGEVTARTTPRA